MNWESAHLINNNAFRIGAGWEKRVIQMFRDMTDTDSFLQELDEIMHEQIKALDNCLILAYKYSLNATLNELNDISFTIPAFAKGYSKIWCKDGKDYMQRILFNINNTKAEIQGLLLSWNGDDQIVLLGLNDIITKAENEWKRLIRTELEAASVQGCRDANLIKGAKYAVIENDSPCDGICKKMVGEYEVSLDGRLGTDLPPYHPNCRCVFLGIFGQN